MTDSLTRRLFCAHLAAGAAVALGPPAKRPGAGKVRIAGLTLSTSRSIETMRLFYASLLGFEVAEESDERISFRAGVSTLTFVHTPSIDANYHFAFNIPSDQILDAHAWQGGKTELITPPKHLNDAGLPREVVAFRHWNAHSVFFWDPAGNAVEYIARHELRGAAPEDRPFSPASIRRISEIGLIVDDVPGAANTIKDALRVEQYIGASNEFEPVGDANALLLMMKRGRKMAFGQGAERGVYPTDVRLEGEPAARVDLDGYPYTVG